MAWVVGLGLAEDTGETESLGGVGLDDVVEEGVVGRPAGLTMGGEGAGDFRDRNGEIVEVLWDLELLPNIDAEKER